jgi:hypothetical protein
VKIISEDEFRAMLGNVAAVEETPQEEEFTGTLF